MLKPYKTQDGFTLLETMVALLVIVVCLTILGPIITRVSAERHSVIQSETALTLLNNYLTEWSAGSTVLPAETIKNKTQYQLIWNRLDAETMQLCILWKNSAERNTKLCGKAKR